MRVQRTPEQRAVRAAASKERSKQRNEEQARARLDRLHELYWMVPQTLDEARARDVEISYLLRNPKPKPARQRKASISRSLSTARHDGRPKRVWRDGLQDFVAHYNHENHTSYTLTKCLDIPRIGARTDKEPEVLLTDSATTRQMVVERKSVVWPNFFLQRHEHGHIFSNSIFHQTQGSFQGSHYELTASTDELDHLNKNALKKIAMELGSLVNGNRPLLDTLPTF
jgi:hypothetical protein